MVDLLLPERAAGAELGKSRLFFALVLEPAAAAMAGRMARGLRAEHGLTGLPLQNERFHVTLELFGDHEELPEGLVAAVSWAADSVVARPFVAMLDRVVSFGKEGWSNRPLVLLGGDGTGGIWMLYDQLEDALKEIGFQPNPRTRFNPHVTLLYDAHGVVAQWVEPVLWRVNEFVLIESLLGRTRHIVRGRWPLEG